ncbi:hypothetical protein NDU88_002982 [Pleurodeles waltl]|uniref:Uncharacterized protein n=1 Tax=Pleurodeles waltl TaxID=8319 RepID=A0AAV7VC47_PLEWA|nr:hypothetical protein NDU88_002982 [Pleurodeles waltl]
MRPETPQCFTSSAAHRVRVHQRPYGAQTASPPTGALPSRELARRSIGSMRGERAPHHITLATRQETPQCFTSSVAHCARVHQRPYGTQIASPPTGTLPSRELARHSTGCTVSERLQVPTCYCPPSAPGKLRLLCPAKQVCGAVLGVVRQRLRRAAGLHDERCGPRGSEDPRRCPPRCLP